MSTSKDKFLRLRSSILEKGPKVTQIIHFVHGDKKTFPGVYGDSVVEGSFVHFQTDDGRLVLVNPKNVLCVEVFREDSPTLPHRKCVAHTGTKLVKNKRGGGK